MEDIKDPMHVAAVNIFLLREQIQRFYPMLARYDGKGKTAIYESVYLRFVSGWHDLKVLGIVEEGDPRTFRHECGGIILEGIANALSVKWVELSLLWVLCELVDGNEEATNGCSFHSVVEGRISVVESFQAFWGGRFLCKVRGARWGFRKCREDTY